MAYKYELHLHTRVAAACGRLTPEEVVKLYTAMGYTGIFITEHFLNGNSSVDRSLPWAEKIDRYAEGYRQVRAAAEGTGLDVFFGVEYHVGNAAEVLLYGITPEWLTDHEEIMSMGPTQVMDFFRANGILVYQAHPFRKFIKRCEPSRLDGIEVFNGHTDSARNALALEWAESLGKPMISGSDCHREDDAATGGIIARPIKTNADLLEVLRSGEYELIKNK